MSSASSERVMDVMVDSLTDVQSKLQMMNDVLNVMDWAIESALDELQQNGSISEEGGLLEEYKAAIQGLHRKGFRRPRSAAKEGGVKCPGCQALLKNVEGKSGDRCDWCGYVFR